MSRGELAEAVNDHLWRATGKRCALDAHTIARYERGKVRWPSAYYRGGFKAVLGAESDADLGFHPTRRGPSGAGQQGLREDTNPALGAAFGEKDNAAGTSAPHRSDAPGMGFMRGGLFGVGLDLGQSPARFLAETVMGTPVPARVGWTDVEYVRGATRAIAESENLFGGGLCCEAASSQLRWAGALLEARASNDVRTAMYESVGNLSSVVAFSAFDIANYAAADRYFHFALWCAERAGSWALRANTLAEMARKAVYFGDLDDALTFIELAQVRGDHLSSTAQAMLWTLRARILALTGKTEDVHADIERADACFSARDPKHDPPWLCYYDEAEHQGSTGKALIPLALHTGHPELAVPRLHAAIRLHCAHYPRSRVFSRIRLASLLMKVGDPHEAVPTARQALTEAGALRSTRIAHELRGLERAAAAHTRIDEVGELHRDVAAAVTAHN